MTKNATRHKLLALIEQKGCLLSDNEAFDFYTENVMRNDAACKLNQWKNQGAGKYEDYELTELVCKAAEWHRRAVGHLVLKGELRNEFIKLPEGEI